MILAVHPWLSALGDRFVHPRLMASPDEARRARLLIGFAFVSVPLGAIFVALAVANYHMPLIAVVSGTATATAAITPWVLRRTGSLAIASGAMLTTWVLAMLVASSRIEGQSLLTLPWLAVVPLLATTLAGRGAGIFWALVCIVLAEAETALDRAGVFAKEVTSADALRVASGWNVALLVFIVFAFAILYESLRLQSMAALTDAQRELEAAREKSLLDDRLASLGKMAAGVAHEINNPMAFVSSNFTLLREDLSRGPLDPALLREYVDDILPATAEGIRRVIDIVKDLRQFARGDAERGVRSDFNDEVRTALRLCEKTLGDCQLHVDLGSLPSAVGRARQIAQVTMNLVLNAAHALKPGGEIRVVTRSEGDDIVLRVTDDGVGMTSDVKARIFEPFFTTKPVGEGTGLGLAVVHGIVLAHGGSVRVDSTLERGSSFEVRLPAAPSVG